MRCKDFLALHSDFRDGVITDPSMERRMRQHRSRCRSCDRQAEALELGVTVLRDLEEVEPSDRFRVNLRVRMALANRHHHYPPVFGWPARAAATLLVLTVIVTGLVEQNREEESPTAPPTRVVSSTPGDVSRQAIPTLAPPEFHLPAFHQPVGNTRSATPRVTFSMTEDPEYYSVPVTLSR